MPDEPKKPTVSELLQTILNELKVGNKLIIDSNELVNQIKDALRKKGVQVTNGDASTIAKEVALVPQQSIGIPDSLESLKVIINNPYLRKQTIDKNLNQLFLVFKEPSEMHRLLSDYEGGDLESNGTYVLYKNELSTHISRCSSLTNVTILCNAPFNYRHENYNGADGKFYLSYFDRDYDVTVKFLDNTLIFKDDYSNELSDTLGQPPVPYAQLSYKKTLALLGDNTDSIPFEFISKRNNIFFIEKLDHTKQWFVDSNGDFTEIVEGTTVYSDTKFNYFDKLDKSKKYKLVYRGEARDLNHVLEDQKWSIYKEVDFSEMVPVNNGDFATTTLTEYMYKHYMPDSVVFKYKAQSFTVNKSDVESAELYDMTIDRRKLKFTRKSSTDTEGVVLAEFDLTV